MSALMKVKLIPWLQWIQVGNQAGKSDFVAVFSKGNEDTEDNGKVCFRKRTERSRRKSCQVNTCCSVAEHRSEQCIERDTARDNVKLHDPTWNNKQTSAQNICPADSSDIQSNVQVCSDSVGGCARENELQWQPVSEECKFTSIDYVAVCGDQSAAEISHHKKDTKVQREIVRSSVLCRSNSDLQDSCSVPETTNVHFLPELRKSWGVFQRLICDKTDDLPSEQSSLACVNPGLARNHISGSVTETDRKEALKDLHNAAQNSESCDESDEKSSWEGGRECKHKHPVVPTPYRVRLDSIAAAGTTDNDFHMNCNAPCAESEVLDVMATEANVEFMNCQRGVVRYSQVLEWQLTVDASDDSVLSVSSVSSPEQDDAESCPEPQSSNIEEGPRKCECEECSPPQGTDPNDACANHQNATSSKHKSLCACDSSKRTDESVDDSAVGLNSVLLEDVHLNKYKYTENRNVKGAITDNNHRPKSPRCPCCFISADGPLEALLPGTCVLHAGCEPDIESDRSDYVLNQSELKLQAGQAGLPSGASSSNISCTDNRNSPSCDGDEEEEEAPISRERVVFCCADQLLSGEENEGMPHVGDPVDSRSSCYGIQRPQAATTVPANAKAKLASLKTAQNSVQLRVVTGKSKLSSGTSALKQTQSEGNKDTSSPIGSDALNSDCAGPTHSYAAVLRGNVKVEHHKVAEESRRPTSASDIRRAVSRQTEASSPVRGTTDKSGVLSQKTGHIMGNQNSAGAAGERSRTPMLGRRKNSTQGLFRTPSASVPVTPAGTPASIRSEKVGFFRKFRRNKNRSRSGSMASINSLSSCASTVSHNVPGRGVGHDDSTSRDSQSSLATNSSLGGEVFLDLPCSAPSHPTSANVAAPPHNVFRPQSTMLQPISEKSNEMYSTRVNNGPVENDARLVGTLPEHIRDVGHSLLRHREGTTGSNLTLTDDGSEYLTASEPDVSEDSVNNNPVPIEGFNCDDYKVTRGTHSDGIASGDIRNSPLFHSEENRPRLPHSNQSKVDSRKIVGNKVANQSARSDHKQDPAKLSASKKRDKSGKQRAASKGKSDKSQSQTYAAVLGTGLFMASLGDSTNSNSSHAEKMDLDVGNEQISVASKNSPSSPTALVSQTAKTETPSTPTFSRSFADVVNTPPTTKRVVHPPRGPFGSLTRKNSNSSANEKLSETDQPLQGTPGLHGKLPISAARHGIRTGQKSVVVEPTNKVHFVNVANQQPPSTQSGGTYKNIRPKTFVTAGSQGSGKGQIGVKTVPGGNAGSPATTPDGPGGVTCHTLPRSTLSPAGSAPALGVCGARLRAAKAQSVQQLNASKSPPLSPVKPPEQFPFSESSFLVPQTKSMPQIVVSRDDISLGIKVKSEGTMKGRYESSSLPRLSKRNKAAVMPKLLTETQPGIFAGTKISDLKLNNALAVQTNTAAQPKGKPVSIPSKTLITKMPGDKVSAVRTDVSVRRETGGSVAQTPAAENSGSLHTCPQREVATKSDSKSTQQDEIPVKPPLRQSRKSDPRTDSHVRAEMSRVPVAQKAGAPGPKVDVEEPVTQGEIHDQCSSGQRRNEARGVKTIKESTNKVLLSPPSQQQSVADKEQHPQSVCDQPETKHTNENASTLLSKEGEGDTSELVSGGQSIHTQSDVVEKPSRLEVFAPHQGGESSTVSSPNTQEVNLIVVSPGLKPNSDSEPTDTSSPSEITKTVSAVSRTGNGKQADKSERIPDQDTVSSSTGTIGAPANVIANQPASEPTNLDTADKKRDRRNLLADDPNKEVLFVTGIEQSNSKPGEAPQPAIQHIDCTPKSSFHIEKVPPEHLALSAKDENTRLCISADRSAPTDDISENPDTPEMGSGESKCTENDKKVTLSKVPVQNKKKAAQKKSRGDCDEREEGEKKPSGPSKEKEVESTRSSTAQVRREEVAPRPPPRTHKVTSVRPSQSQTTQGEKNAHENMSKSLREDSSAETNNIAGNNKRSDAGVENERPVSANSNTVKEQLDSERSSSPLKPNVGSRDEDLSDKTEGKSVRERINETLCQQTPADADNKTKNTSDVISLNNATTRLDSSEVTEGGGAAAAPEEDLVQPVTDCEDFGFRPNLIVSGSESEALAPRISAQANKVDAEREIGAKNEPDQVNEDSLCDCKQGDKQNEAVDKHAVNIVESGNVQVPGVASSEREYSVSPDNDTCPSPSQTSDVSVGSKPKIFDEMISVKNVIVCSESSSSCTSLEMDEIIEDDMQSSEICEALPRSVSEQVEPNVDGVCISEPPGKVLCEGKADGLVPKIRVSIDQPDAAPADDPVYEETKIITEEEVTFTIDIPAESGRALPEVNAYVSATCVAVTSTSGTVNTTSRVGESDTTTSVSDGQTLMSVGGGGDQPRATVTTGGDDGGGGEAVSTHQKDERAVNICIDRGVSSAGGLHRVSRAGHEEAAPGPASTSGTDHNAHTTDVQRIPLNETTNEASQNKMEMNIESQSQLENNNEAAMSTARSNLNAVTEDSRVKQVEQQHVEPISNEPCGNAESGSQEGQNASISGGKHPDKSSPSDESMEFCAAEHAVKAVDPISLLKPSEREPTHSTGIASSQGSGCDDQAYVHLGAEQIVVGCATSDTASKNTLPQIAITTEISDKNSLVVENPPAESNIVGVDARDYLTVDDHLGGRGAESDSSSIGRLIHSSEGEQSDMNLDDIVVRNMDDYNNVIESRRTKPHRRFDSSESSECDESDEVSSVRETDSEDLSEEEDSEGKMLHIRRPDTINDSDLSDSCDKLKAGWTKEKIEDSKKRMSSGEDENPKKSVTDDENHIKPVVTRPTSTDVDCYATKLENTGHKVGEAYFVTRRRKRAKMVDRETLTTSVAQVQVPDVRSVATDTFDSVLISSSGSSDTSPSRVQWEDDSVDELDGARYEGYSDEWYDDEFTDDSLYSDEDKDAQLGATAAGPVKVIYSRPRPDHSSLPLRD